MGCVGCRNMSRPRPSHSQTPLRLPEKPHHITRMHELLHAPLSRHFVGNGVVFMMTRDGDVGYVASAMGW